MAPVAAATLVGSTVVDEAGVVGQYTSLISEPRGRQHLAYFDSTNSALKYATCGCGCTSAANWQKATVDGAGTGIRGQFASLEVDGSGRWHMSYYDATNTALTYATCLDGTNCTSARGWQSVTVDRAETVGSFTSLAVGADGRPQISYYIEAVRGFRKGDLRYATCLTNCTDASGWVTVTVDESGDVGAYSSIAVGPDGRRHITYFRYVNGAGTSVDDLRYATCLTNCTQAANWQTLTIDSKGRVGTHASLALDGNGVLHVSYHEDLPFVTTGALKYARCAAACSNARSWGRVTVDANGNAGWNTSIAVDGNRRVHISHYDAATGDLDYASCAADCLNSLNWTSPHVDGKFADVGAYSSLALGSGRVHISYHDYTNGDLKYLEFTP